MCLVTRNARGLEVVQHARVADTEHAALSLSDMAVSTDAVIASGTHGMEMAAATESW